MDANQEKTTEEKKEGEIINTNSESNNNEQTKETNEEEKIKENNIEKAIIEVEKKRRKGSYITGTIGAIIGAFIAVIPLLLRYALARENFAITLVSALCTSFISVLAYFGYKLFGGRITKKLRIIILIVSLLVVIIATTIICPAILMIEFAYPVTFQNWLNLFSDARADVRASIIEDLIVGVVITIISFIIMVRVSSKKIKNQVEINKRKLKRQIIEQSGIIKKACIGLNVMSKENAVTKTELINELELIYNIKRKTAKKYFKICKAYKLIKKYKGKYYYDETNELEIFEDVGNKKIRRIPLKVKIISLVVIIIGIIVAAIIIKINKGNILTGTDIKLNVSKAQILYDTDEEITEEFGAETAAAYDFIIKDKEANKYDIYAQTIPKTSYIGYDFATIMQEDRDYYAQYFGEDIMSEVFDKDFNNKEFKCYTYTYGNEIKYRAYIYLYNTDVHYIWLNLYTDYDVDMEQADNIIMNLFK